MFLTEFLGSLSLLHHLRRPEQPPPPPPTQSWRSSLSGCRWFSPSSVNLFRLVRYCCLVLFNPCVSLQPHCISFSTTDTTYVKSPPSCPTETLQGSDHPLGFGLFAESSIVKFSFKTTIHAEVLAQIQHCFIQIPQCLCDLLWKSVDSPYLFASTSHLRFHHASPSQTSTVLHRVGPMVLPPLSSSPELLCKSVDSPYLLATLSLLRLHHNTSSQVSTVSSQSPF